MTSKVPLYQGAMKFLISGAHPAPCVPVRPQNGHFVSALCVEGAISPCRGDIRHLYGKIESFLEWWGVTEPSKAVVAF